MRKRSTKPKLMSLVDLIGATEYFITRCTTPPATRGKNKGHGTTDVLQWIVALTVLCDKQIKFRNRGGVYDGNMAIAALLGTVLCSWYAQVQLAKGFDPNRPLNRRRVFKHLVKFRNDLLCGVTDERIMGKVWGRRQQWNFPFGKGAKGGKFV